MDFTAHQVEVIVAPMDAKLFLRGVAGCGKTAAAVARVLALVNAGVPASSILVLTPQRTLQDPYTSALLEARLAGGEVTPATIGGLARRMCDLFWPLAAELAGFKQPDLPPVFLTLETAQYYMAHLVRPKLDEGWFDSLTMDRNRLYAQILDNLGKAASVGFDYRDTSERLTAAWTGDPAQKRIYADAQAAASLFREYCLEHNLLDYSLQLEIFAGILWNDASVRNYLTNAYRHIIYDNIEEDIPRAHDIVAEWLPELDSALMVYDDGGGFRQFLGADPLNGIALRELCETEVIFNESFVVSKSIAQLGTAIEKAIYPGTDAGESGDNSEAFSFTISRFYPEMLDSVTEKVAELLDSGLPASEIAILSPYLSDALRFSLMNRLEARGIPVRSHRPSRSLREEPASQALLTLAALAHPEWNIRPSRFDIAYAFMMALDMDLVRAQLLSEIVYRAKDMMLFPFDAINAEMQERITFTFGQRYGHVRDWMLVYRSGDLLPLDHFLRRLFGEVLSQPGFGFHRNYDAARTAASLIESTQKFRVALEAAWELDAASLGREYIEMLKDGVIAAQYLQPYQNDNQAVLVVPATTFLMLNRPVTVQFWLDPGAAGWVERLFQPLTHPFVLSRHWEKGKLWTDNDEVAVETESLARLTTGLLRRCRAQVILSLAELGETGFEQRGSLLKVFQKVLQGQKREMKNE